MPRIYVREITVAPGDIDVQGHVNNVRYVEWMQEIAIAHSTAQGWSMAHYVEEGAGWVVWRHTVTYRRPAFAGDVLAACTWISLLAHRQSTRRYLFRRAADRAVTVEAETQWAFVDLKTGRPIAIPDSVRSAFAVVTDDGEVKRMLEERAATSEA